MHLLNEHILIVTLINKQLMTNNKTHIFLFTKIMDYIRRGSECISLAKKNTSVSYFLSYLFQEHPELWNNVYTCLCSSRTAGNHQ